MESDPRHNPFAEDAVLNLGTLLGAGLRLAVLSDIHFDLRSAFEAAGLTGAIDAFILLFEQGPKKPDPACLRRSWRRSGRRPTRR